MKLTPVIILAAAAGALYYFNHLKTSKQDPTPEAQPWPALGEVVFIHKGVPIYSNGEDVYKSNGKHYAADGYYYGHKWQCVEFIKRYYHDAHQHNMPDVWGHAVSFFDPKIPHANLNPARNMQQYYNAYSEPPKAEDLLVWGGRYGHVAIISEVHDDHVIIVQQNIKYQPQARLPLIKKDKLYILQSDSGHRPLGWLRINPKS